MTSSHTDQFNHSGTSAQEAWFSNNVTTATGGQDNYPPQEGGYQFEPFKINVTAAGNGGTLTTQSATCPKAVLLIQRKSRGHRQTRQ